MSKESDEYEEFVQSVMAALTGVEVNHKAEFTGVRSGRTIITDVSFLLNAAGSDIQVVVECKYYTHKVGVDEIEEFRTKLDDMNVQKGIVVTTIGFQSGAIKSANAYGIALALITPDEQPDELEYIVKSDMRETPPKESLFLHGIVHDNYSSGNPIRFKDGADLTEILKWHIIKNTPFEL